MRRALVWEMPLGTVGIGAELIEREGASVDDLSQLAEPREMIYDGANAYLRVGERWTGFFLGDPAGPRTINDPLWPLDALFGARDAVDLGDDVVRGAATTRYRVTIDLPAADAALQAGVSVPAGPYRALRQITAEVWLDSVGRSQRIAVLTDALAAGEPIWSVVELWDFGVAADIAPPDAVVSPREAFGIV